MVIKSRFSRVEIDKTSGELMFLLFVRLNQMNCLDIDLNAKKYKQTSERLIANFEILIIISMRLN